MKEYDFVVIGSGHRRSHVRDRKAANHGKVAIITKRKGRRFQHGVGARWRRLRDKRRRFISTSTFAIRSRRAPVCAIRERCRRSSRTGRNEFRELIEFGLHFDERDDLGHRELDLGREGGHSKRRVLQCRISLVTRLKTTLPAKLRAIAAISSLLENHMAVDLITAG